MAGGGRSKRSDKTEPEPEQEGNLCSIDIVKELISVQESTIKAFFSALTDSTNVRIDNLIKEVQELKQSIELTQADVEALKSDNPSSRVKNLEKNIEDLIEKTDDLENRSRRNNLCFGGIHEQSLGNESWERSEEKLKDLINNQLQLNAEEVIIERAHRIGRKQPENPKPRPIIAKFLSYKHRDVVLKASKKLKGTRQAIREDFSDRVIQKRKELLPKMYEARNEGKIAYLSYDKLVVKQPRYNQIPVPGYYGPTNFIPQPVMYHAGGHPLTARFSSPTGQVVPHDPPPTSVPDDTNQTNDEHDSND